MDLGLFLGFGEDFGMGVTGPRLTIVGTRGMIPAALFTAGAGNTLIESRISCDLASAPSYDHQIMFANMWTGTGDQEAANAFTFNGCGIEHITPAGGQRTKKAYFAGEPSRNAAVSAPFIVTDVMPFSFLPSTTNPAQNRIWVRPSITIADGASYPGGHARKYGTGSSGGSDYFVKGSGSSYQCYGLGGLTGTAINPVSTTPAGFGHLAIFGKTETSVPSGLIYCDSIGAADGESGASIDDSSPRALGMFERGLVVAGANGGAIGWSNLSRSGDQAQYSGSDLTTLYRRLLLSAAPNIIGNLGTNDLVNGRGLTNLQNDLTWFWRACRMRGQKITWTTLIPRVSGTYTTPGGQTPVAGFEVGGLRDQHNIWLKGALAAGLIDYLVDPNVYLEDPANPGKWVTTDNIARTADGIHPNQLGATSAAPAITAVAQKWTGWSVNW